LPDFLKTVAVKARRQNKTRLIKNEARFTAGMSGGIEKA
jgi:hypothetical protein